MIAHKIIYVTILILQIKYCFGGCQTTNNHKNHTCTGFRFNQIVLSLSTRKTILRTSLLDCKETEIQENSLNFPSAESLTISCNTINILHKDAFKTMVHLKQLNLENNKISALPTDLFLPNQQLEILNLGNNRFEKLTKDTFKSIPNIKILFLSNNQINDFELKVFQHNQELEELYLNQNEINFLSVTLINPLRKVNTIDLSHNSLEVLPAMFANNYQLEKLNLSYNEIKDLRPKIFDTTKLKVLDLSFNQMSVIHEDSLPLKTLQELYLQNNQIEIFDVSANGIVNYPLNVLDLRNNRIVFLEDSFIKNSVYLSTLIVDNNPWDCKCFENMVLLRGDLEVEISVDHRTGEEPICVYENKESCDISKTDVGSYYKILEDYWKLR